MEALESIASEISSALGSPGALGLASTISRGADGCGAGGDTVATTALCECSQLVDSEPLRCAHLGVHPIGVVVVAILQMIPWSHTTLSLAAQLTA